jgi:hypothetical protein
VSAAIQSIIIAVVGLILAIVLGSVLGQGDWVIPIAVIGAGLLLGLYKLFFKAVRLEALILGFLIFGYIVGNRGFAQLRLTHTSPVYLGEAGMLACIGILASRLALKRERLFPKTPLSWAIVAFVFIGGVRLCCDISGLSPATIEETLRDSAAVYYALFFFIAYKVGSDRVGRRVMERFILIGFLLLLPIFIIQFFAFPGLFNRITVRGYPLIAHKGDLTATYLGFASFYFFLRPSRGSLLVLSRILSAVFFLGMIALMGRASMVGFALAVVFVLIARRPQFAFYQIATACLALLIVGLLQVTQLSEKGGFFSQLTDRVESMADFSGTGNYRSQIGDVAANNNEFRTVWWRSVYNETMRKHPWFGLGFGYDLTAGFMRAYFPTGGEDTAATRSPHSIWVTILGRMGIVGWLSFAAIAYLIAREALTTARMVARGALPPSALSFWTGTIIILGSASFGVVLEGPMGGILFWTFLGLASSQLHEQKASRVELPAGSEMKTRSDRRLIPA